MCAGVCPSIIQFGEYLRRRHKVLPKAAMADARHRPPPVCLYPCQVRAALRELYGPIDIVECTVATEGTCPAAGRRRLLVPNFDLYYFEVLLKGGQVKVLHDLLPGEVAA